MWKPGKHLQRECSKMQVFLQKQILCPEAAGKQTGCATPLLVPPASPIWSPLHRACLRSYRHHPPVSPCPVPSGGYKSAAGTAATSAQRVPCASWRLTLRPWLTEVLGSGAAQPELGPLSSSGGCKQRSRVPATGLRGPSGVAHPGPCVPVGLL